MRLSFRCTELRCHFHYNIPQMRFNIFHRWKGRIIKRKEMWEKSVLWGLQRCFQSLQSAGHFKTTWQLILFYFLRCIFFMLIPFHPWWEDKYKTRVYEVKSGSKHICNTEPKASLLSIFRSSAKAAVWATPADCGHICGCLEVCLSLRAVCHVYVHVCVVRLGTKADTHHQRSAPSR